ncbi:MAG: hypothetical protein KH031_10155 [Clostridiales bacterium]|nr:hypothetical protein [Clostridiales bacterium]
MLENIKYLIGLFITICPFIYTYFSNSKYRKGWLISVKEKGSYFFAKIIFFSIAISFTMYCILLFIRYMSSVFITEAIINTCIFYICACVLYLIACKVFLRLKFVKLKNMPHRKSNDLLMISPMFILLCLYFIYNKVEWLSSLLYILFLVIETIGLLRFSDTYFIYPYTYVNIDLSDGSHIKQIDIDKIKCESSWVIISLHNKELRIKTETITKVEYYGEKIIKLKSILKKEREKEK